MRGEIVALDLEATGLDPSENYIIEIGAVRVHEGKIKEEFSTLIDPGVPIPEAITLLTGISDEDVIGAPKFSAIRQQLHDFIGDAPILGHKVSWDVSLLQNHNIARHNSLIDTYEMAAFLLPMASRYNLGSLTQELNLDDLDNAHRALDDTIATCNLYWALWEMLLELPFHVLRAIADAIYHLEGNPREIIQPQWGATLPVLDALAIRSHSALEESQQSLMRFTPSQRNEWQTLRANRDKKMLPVDEVAHMIEPNGLLSKYIENYESRPSQVKMLQAIINAFNSQQHLMIEAPTGTGKSLAYLLPAIYWAATNNARVVIATNTIALQDQIMKHDIPMLSDILDVDFEAAVGKGRSNYLCPRRFQALLRRGPNSVDEMRVLAKVLVWLLHSASGDRSEISLRGFGEDLAWLQLSAQDEGCKLSHCEIHMNGACPFFKARRQAESAHILVVNHAMLLSDVQVGNRVLPDYKYLIIDEAHHLEEATTNGLAVRINRSLLRRRLADLGNSRRGLLGEMMNTLRESEVPSRYLKRIAPYVSTVADAVKDMYHHINAYFDYLINLLDKTQDQQNNSYMSQVRITPQLRQHPDWKEQSKRWKHLSEFLHAIAVALDKVAGVLKDLDAKGIAIENFDEMQNSLQAASRFLQEQHYYLETFTDEPADNMIYWCSLSPSTNQLTIHAAPLHVGPLIVEHIWQPKDCVVLTSATLTTGNSFGYIRERLNATREQVSEMTVTSPFDYEQSTLIFIPEDMPEPNNRYEYQQMVERAIIELATATDGRLLGLFTSYAQLRQTAQAIAPRLALGGISVFDQGSGTSRQLLIEGFKTSEKAVLLGTRSFWEGVDLPGDDLQALVIVRLPFTVPSDPIFSARAETFQNHFLDYAVPDAVLRFRQGFGRLIRRRTDRGIVAILDKRIISKRYGRIFLQSLPDCTVKRGLMSHLANAAENWLNQSE